uniref:Uncharacterized protein n=1 Tax=Percolomonas cosmopolitus TaxID=63605 RepID=A0A7S1KL51_9EUKA|mmetsp:Transcript_10494/g.39024  ORF Transcript_10494/g.39024 Transcript_10494/m.39024 type:complete len:443 (+) Transcript_10494:160-1488(+)
MIPVRSIRSLFQLYCIVIVLYVAFLDFPSPTTTTKYLTKNTATHPGFLVQGAMIEESSQRETMLELSSSSSFPSLRSFVSLSISFTFFEQDWGSERNIILYSLAGGLLLNFILFLLFGCCCMCMCCILCFYWYKRRNQNRRQRKRLIERGGGNEEESSDESSLMQSKGREGSVTRTIMTTPSTESRKAPLLRTQRSSADDNTPVLLQQDIELREVPDSHSCSLIEQLNSGDKSSDLASSDDDDDDHTTSVAHSQLKATYANKKVELSQQNDQMRQIEQQVQNLRVEIDQLENETGGGSTSSTSTSTFIKERQLNQSINSREIQHKLQLSEQRLRAKKLMLRTFAELDNNEQMHQDIQIKSKHLVDLERQRESMKHELSALQNQIQHTHAMTESQDHHGEVRINAMNEMFEREREQHRVIVSTLENELRRLRSSAKQLLAKDR